MFLHRQLMRADADEMRAAERLSSGRRILRGADDAAGLAIAERMDGQVRGLGQAARNTSESIDLVQTADEALSTVHDMLQRLRELVVYADNGTLSETDRSALAGEASQLGDQVTATGTATQFNGISLLASGVSLRVQAGANDRDHIDFGIAALDSLVDPALFDWSSTTTTTTTTTQTTGGSGNGNGNGRGRGNGNGGGGGTTTTTTTTTTVAGPIQPPALADVDAAIDAISGQRSSLGAIESRLQFASETAASTQEHLMSAESRIADADYATEAVRLAKAELLRRTTTAMLAQAQVQPRLALGLLTDGGYAPTSSAFSALAPGRTR